MNASLLIPNTDHSLASPEKIKHGVEMRRKILLELAEGYTVIQIAARLGVSRQNVQNHLEIMRRLSNTTTTAGVVAWAFRRKIIS